MISSERCRIKAAEWSADAAGKPACPSRLKSERIARAWAALAVSMEIEEAEVSRRRGGR
jgi:hypothetical protein